MGKGRRRAGWAQPGSITCSGLPVGAQAEGGSPEARWHGVKVLTQGAKASSDSGQQCSQGRRMDDQAQGTELDRGQKQMKSGSGWATKCRQVRPGSSRPRLWPKCRGQKCLLKWFWLQVQSLMAYRSREGQTDGFPIYTETSARLKLFVNVSPAPRSSWASLSRSTHHLEDPPSSCSSQSYPSFKAQPKFMSFLKAFSAAPVYQMQLRKNKTQYNSDLNKIKAHSPSCIKDDQSQMIRGRYGGCSVVWDPGSFMLPSTIPGVYTHPRGLRWLLELQTSHSQS